MAGSFFLQRGSLRDGAWEREERAEQRHEREASWTVGPAVPLRRHPHRGSSPRYLHTCRAAAAALQYSSSSSSSSSSSALSGRCSGTEGSERRVQLALLSSVTEGVGAAMVSCD